MSNDGEGEVRKKCPFLNEWCLGAPCALYAELMQQTPFGMKKGGTCSFNALVMMISEINSKTLVPQQRITIPKLLKG